MIFGETFAYSHVAGSESMLFKTLKMNVKKIVYVYPDDPLYFELKEKDHHVRQDNDLLKISYQKIRKLKGKIMAYEILEIKL